MKAEDLIPQAANLVNQLVSFVSAPRAFVRQLDFSADDVFRNALLFFALTVVLSVMLEGFFIPDESDFFESIKNTVIFQVLFLLVISGLLHLSWRLVGGEAGYRIHTILACYFVGVSMVIWSVGALLSKGYLKSRVGDQFEHAVEFINLLLIDSASRDDPLYQEIARNPEVVNGLLIFAVGIVLALIWLLISWGAYRELNKRTMRQAALALLIFLVANYPVGWLFQIVQQAADIALF